jgi:hypothetical protein
MILRNTAIGHLYGHLNCWPEMQKVSCPTVYGKTEEVSISEWNKNHSSHKREPHEVEDGNKTKAGIKA